MKKTILTYLFLIVVLMMTFWSLLQIKSIRDVPRMLVAADKGFIILAVLCMAVFVILDALIMQYISNRAGIPVPFGSSLRFAMIGQYYCLITPWASGAQPAQIYSMTVKGKYSVAQASSVLFSKFVIYQTVVGLYVLILYIARGHIFNGHIGNLSIFLTMGLTLNVCALATIFLLAFNRKILLRISLAFLRMIKKLGWGKNINENRIISQVELFSTYIDRMKSDGQMMLTALGLTALQLTFYFSVTYFVYRGLRVSPVSYLDVLTIQGLIYMAYHFIPTPGNVGVAEGGFILFFRVLFTQQSILAGVLLWRFIVYYLNLAAGGLVTLYEFIWIRKTIAAQA